MSLLPSDLTSLAAVACGGVLAAAIDLRTRRVPNALTLGIAAAGIAAAELRLDSVSLRMACAGGLVGCLFMLPGYVFGATGAGDVKLFAALGTFLGLDAAAIAFLYTAIAGGLLALAVACARSSLGSTVRRAATLVTTAGGNVADIERPTNDNRFAYAPAIAIGVIAAALGTK
jgi:prepilin peptidase CpaA